MPLKRGLKRESCNFCFRRKVKCDRQTRAGQGFDACTQCDARGERCQADDLDASRIRRQRRSIAYGDDTGPEPGNWQLSGDGNLSGNREQPPESVMPVTLPPASAASAACDQAAPSLYPDDFYFDDPFILSDGSLSFLDQVFTGGSLPSEWSDGVSRPIEGDATRRSIERITNNMADASSGGMNVDGLDSELFGDGQVSGLLLDGVANGDITTAAIHAYFDVAASYLPILIEDAFWADVHAGRCSTSLIYAVACRGMPFTVADNKWELQQQLARKFRETFLDARAAVLDDGSPRLDDLEALALMLGFEYDDAASSPIHANLGRLFLTHESLVLMMLQFQRHDDSTPNAPRSAPPSRTRERRVLLNWHVYGIDAFHCLDRKQQSHIPDDDAIGDEILSQHEAKDYFDAVLALAIVARKITHSLCSTAARRKGVSTDDVRLMYELLAHWRSHSCPIHLQRRRDGAGNLVAGEDNNVFAAVVHLQLRRAVLWALEINCIMQIEASVSTNRLQDEDGLGTERVALQVEYESFHAVTEMVDICTWMRKIEAEDGRAAQYRSLVDLAPVLRNICAGLCFWASQRGIDVQELGGSPAFRAYARKGSRKKEQVERYRDAAQLLRNMVATAVSHRDTADILQRLDKQRALLEL